MILYIYNLFMIWIEENQNYLVIAIASALNYYYENFLRY